MKTFIYLPVIKTAEIMQSGWHWWYFTAFIAQKDIQCYKESASGCMIVSMLKITKNEEEMIYQHFGHFLSKSKCLPGTTKVFAVTNNRPETVADQWLTKSVYQSKSKCKRKTAQATDSVSENRKKIWRSSYQNRK